MSKQNIDILLENYGAMYRIDAEDKTLRYVVERYHGQTQYFVFRRICELAINSMIITGEKWFHVESDSEQNENSLKALTVNFITKNFGSKRIAIKKGHGYKLSNLYKKLRVIR